MVKGNDLRSTKEWMLIMLSKKRYYSRNMGVFQKILSIIIYSALDCGTVKSYAQIRLQTLAENE
ncbi:MAG: hypothetical protein ACOCN3_14995, partial [Roseburia inulinivorans]